MLRISEDASSIEFIFLTSDDGILFIYDDLHGEFALSQRAMRQRTDENKLGKFQAGMFNRTRESGASKSMPNTSDSIMGPLYGDKFCDGLLATREDDQGDHGKGNQFVRNRNQKLDHFKTPERTKAMAEWEIVLTLVGDLIGALAVKGVVNRDDITKILQGSITVANLDARSDLLDELTCIRHVTINSCSRVQTHNQ